MKRLLKIVLLLLGAGSVYAVLNIGLGYLWTIGVVENADRINHVLLNLSYSYLAGCIFYLLVTALPEFIRTRKAKDMLGSKYESIRKQVMYSIQSFHDKYLSEDSIASITVDDLTQALNSKSMQELSYYAKVTGIQNDIIHFLCDTRDEICKICSSTIQTYLPYMDVEQIETLEKIMASPYCNMMRCGKRLTQREIEYFDTPVVKKDIAQELYSLVKIVNSLIRSK